MSGALTYLASCTLLLLDASSAWWSGTTAGWIGGIFGSLVGLGGALIGILASRGRSRRLVLGLVLGLVVLGACSVAIGVVAVLLGQPYAVYYPLLLLGGISLFVFGMNWPMLRARYRQQELRRMQAEDLLEN